MKEKIFREKLSIKSFFKEQKSLSFRYLEELEYPWLIIPEIKNIIKKIASNLDENYVENENNVWIHKTARVAKSVHIEKNVIIGANAELRHCAHIRENVLIGEGAVIGTASEIKNSILFDKVAAPHYNYVGDSILGYKAHLGAGAITSNVKGDSSLVTIPILGEQIETKLKKIGAILGDKAEIGCNSVLNPGTIIGKYSQIYPLSMVRGFVPENSIYKNQGEIIKKR